MHGITRYTNYKIGITQRVQLVNLETTKGLKKIKINKNASKKLKRVIIFLFKEFEDIFAWSYKVFRRMFIIISKHTIDLLPNMFKFNNIIIT